MRSSQSKAHTQTIPLHLHTHNSRTPPITNTHANIHSPPRTPFTTHAHNSTKTTRSRIPLAMSRLSLTLLWSRRVRAKHILEPSTAHPRPHENYMPTPTFGDFASITAHPQPQPHEKHTLTHTFGDFASISHIIAVESADPVTNSRPSSDRARHVTRSVCVCFTCSRRALPASSE